jgi:ABC-2 type transport system ATP-binding protein
MSVLTARGAGVRRGRRWLFRDLDVTVEPGETVAVIGPPGSGRTTVLLALARRFRLSAGRVAMDGTAALGHVPEVSSPEPVFTVAEHVRERLALLGRSRSEAAGVPLHGLDPGRRGRELTPYEKQVLGLVLARLSRPAVIALDGVDAGLDAAEQANLWCLLDEVAATGTAVLVTAREIDVARVSRVIRLGPESKAPEAALPRASEEPGPQVPEEVESRAGAEAEPRAAGEAESRTRAEEASEEAELRAGEEGGLQASPGAERATEEAAGRCVLGEGGSSPRARESGGVSWRVEDDVRVAEVAAEGGERR